MVTSQTTIRNVLLELMVRGIWYTVPELVELARSSLVLDSDDRQIRHGELVFRRQVANAARQFRRDSSPVEWNGYQASSSSSGDISSYRIPLDLQLGILDVIEMEKEHITDKLFLTDHSGNKIDSDFLAFRQGSCVVIHILSLGGSGPNKRGTQMRTGKVIAVERMRKNNLEIMAILTANAGQKIRYSDPPIIPSSSDCVVRISRDGNPLTVGDDVSDWCKDLWKEASGVAASGENNPDRPLLFYIRTDREPGEILELVTNRRVSVAPNSIPPTHRGRKQYTVQANVDTESGFVYILHNVSWSGWIKIGKAADLGSRMEGYRTYQPHEGAKFIYLCAYPSEIAFTIEQKIHQYLNRKLASDPDNNSRHGEWYHITLQDAISALEICWIGEFPDPTPL